MNEHLRRALELLDELESELSNLDGYTYHSYFKDDIDALKSNTAEQLKQREMALFRSIAYLPEGPVTYIEVSQR